CGGLGAVGFAGGGAVGRAQDRRRGQAHLREVPVLVPRVGLSRDAPAVVTRVLLDQAAIDVVAIEALLIERAVGVVVVAEQADLAEDELGVIRAPVSELTGNTSQ